MMIRKNDTALAIWDSNTGEMNINFDWNCQFQIKKQFAYMEKLTLYRDTGCIIGKGPGGAGFITVDASKLNKELYFHAWGSSSNVMIANTIPAGAASYSTTLPAGLPFLAIWCPK